MRRHVALSIVKELLPQTDFANFVDQPVVCIDSRTLQQGDIFFALRGELHDGHDFIEIALQKGASLIIAEEHQKNRYDETKPIVFVKNTLEAFFSLAHLHLKTCQAVKIAITGSNGKTTTKEMCKAVLCAALGEEKIFANEGNKNNHFGLPLSALLVTPHHQAAIFEMGMNHAGEISALCAIVEPDIGIITNIGHAHEGNFSNGIDGVREAKGELFSFIAQHHGCAIINLDDTRVVSLAQDLGIKNQITFGKNKNADIRLVLHEPISDENQTVIFSTHEGQITGTLPLLGEHNAHNASAALALASALKLPLTKSAIGLSSMKKTRGRFLITKTSKGYTIIDDGYNANPTSMAAGIKASLNIASKRRIAVIGAMGELGANSHHHHQQLGKILAQHFAYLYFCGADCKYAIEAAQEEGFNKSNILYKETSLELVAPLHALLQKDDLVFIKGSLSANMKAITEALID